MVQSHQPPFQNVGNFIHFKLPVSFGRDTKSRWLALKVRSESLTVIKKNNLCLLSYLVLRFAVQLVLIDGQRQIYISGKIVDFTN